LVIGWLISKLIKAVVTKVLRALKLDEVSDKIELDSLLAKGGISYSLSELMGIICYWLAILVTFVVAINAVGLTIAADLLGRIVTFIPQIIAAIFILIAGMFVATLLRNIVRTAANNAGVSYSGLLAKIVEVVVMVFAIVMALDQLAINARIIEWSINIILGAIGLGLALSFGLGCKDIAARAMSEWLEAIKKK
jgi:small-conductance mechanosensitive channel